MNTVIRIARAVMERLMRKRIFVVALVASFLMFGLMAGPIVLMNSMRGGDANAQHMVSQLVLQGSISLMGFFANAVALVLGTSVIRQDISDGTIFSVLSKPVTRMQYFFGSALGVAFCQAVGWATFVLLWLYVVITVDKQIMPVHLIVFFAEVIKSLLMLSLTLAWSQKFSPWIAGMLALLTYGGDNVIKLIAGAMSLFGLHLPDSLLALLVFPFPCFTGLDNLLPLLQRGSGGPADIIWAFIPIINYTCFALLLAWLSFRQQDLSAN